MTVASEAMDAARELLARTPSLGATEALRRVLQDDPDLCRRWHQGEPSEAPAEPVGATVDPAAGLMEHMAACGVTFAEACDDRPDCSWPGTLAGWWCTRPARMSSCTAPSCRRSRAMSPTVA